MAKSVASNENSEAAVVFPAKKKVVMEKRGTVPEEKSDHSIVHDLKEKGEYFFWK